MKVKLLHKNVNIFATVLMTTLVVLLGVFVIQPDADVVQAVDSNATIGYNEISGEYIVSFSSSNFNKYRTNDNYTYPKLYDYEPAVANAQDYLFAGWYTDQACTKAVSTSTTTVSSNVYARFVDASLTSIKCQVIPGTTAESTSTTLRFISTVDREEYQEAGFNITYRGTTRSIPVKAIFKRFESNENGMECGYNPQALNQHANYFMAMSIFNIETEYFDKPFLVQTYWVTRDGTTVYGVERCARVQDSYLRIINLPVILNSNQKITNGDITLSYDTSRFTYWGFDFGTSSEEAKAAGITVFDTVTRTTSTGKVHCEGSVASATAADGMFVNIRLQLKEGALIESTTEFTVTNNGFKNGSSSVTIPVSSVFFRNYSVAYAGASDTSWYDEYATDEEFYISTPADLYGLATIVNDTTGKYKDELFEGKTINLGSNITLNSGTASESGFTAATGTTRYAWTPIGTTDGFQFKGTFDGKGHTISGVYVKKGNLYRGLFGRCSGAIIRNVKLTNSYLECTMTSEARLGSIVGLAQGSSFTMENVYSDAILKSSAKGVGGLVGYVSTSSNSKKVNMTSCWFAGDIYVDIAGETAVAAGGHIGNAVKGTVLLDTCYYTGDIEVTYRSNSTQESWGAQIGGFVARDTATNCPVQIKNSLSAGTIKANWNNNDDGTENKQKEITRTNQFLGYAENTNSSVQNSYTITSVKKYVENTGVTTDSSGYASGMYADGIDASKFAGIDYTFYRSSTDLYSFGARLWTDLPFVARLVFL